LDKHALVSFSKTSNSTRPSDSCYFEVFEKLIRACYIQIALETMLLPILIYSFERVLRNMQKSLLSITDSSQLYIINHQLFKKLYIEFLLKYLSLHTAILKSKLTHYTIHKLLFSKLDILGTFLKRKRNLWM
jgi:hypothetical protein